MKIIFTNEEIKRIQYIKDTERNCHLQCDKCILNILVRGETCYCEYTADYIINNIKNNVLDIK